VFTYHRSIGPEKQLPGQVDDLQEVTGSTWINCTYATGLNWPQCDIRHSKSGQNPTLRLHRVGRKSTNITFHQTTSLCMFLRDQMTQFVMRCKKYDLQLVCKQRKHWNFKHEDGTVSPRYIQNLRVGTTYWLKKKKTSIIDPKPYLDMNFDFGANIVKRKKNFKVHLEYSGRGYRNSEPVFTFN